VRPVAHLFRTGAILSAQNGLGGEEISAELAKTFVNARHDIYERDASQRHTCAVLVGYGDMDGAVRADEDAFCNGAGSRRPASCIRAESCGAIGCAAGAVVQTDFQCIGERCVCADGVAAQFSFRSGK